MAIQPCRTRLRERPNASVSRETPPRNASAVRTAQPIEDPAAQEPPAPVAHSAATRMPFLPCQAGLRERPNVSVSREHRPETPPRFEQHIRSRARPPSGHTPAAHSAPTRMPIPPCEAGLRDRSNASVSRGTSSRNAPTGRAVQPIEGSADQRAPPRAARLSIVSSAVPPCQTRLREGPNASVSRETPTRRARAGRTTPAGDRQSAQQQDAPRGAVNPTTTCRPPL